MFLQRNPKLSCVFASCAPLADVPGVLYKLQKLDADAQGQVYAEMILPPDMAQRRPMMAVEWKETCHCLSGCSPLPPLLQGFSRSSTSLQVYNYTASALSWIKLLTSETIILTTAKSDSMNPLTGLRIYDVVISTPVLDPADHLLAIKVQVNGSLYVSVPQAVALTPGAREHVYRIGVDEALGRFVDALSSVILLQSQRTLVVVINDVVFCSLKGVTLITAGEVSRRILLVHCITLKHGGTQANFSILSPQIRSYSFRIFAAHLQFRSSSRLCFIRNFCPLPTIHVHRSTRLTLSRCLRK
jgi:hypothetical protein